MRLWEVRVEGAQPFGGFVIRLLRNRAQGARHHGARPQVARVEHEVRELVGLVRGSLAQVFEELDDLDLEDL